MLSALPSKEPAHGYEPEQALGHIFGSARPSPHLGQIYVTLGRLKKDGLVRGDDVTHGNRPDKRVHEPTRAGHETGAEWLGAPGERPTPLHAAFFTKPALVPPTGAADRMSPINRQRRHCLDLPRGLSEPGHPRERDRAIATLLIDGARPRLQADLGEPERRQEALT
jgi:DNA-binding PadR family transcriptional regulator